LFLIYTISRFSFYYFSSKFNLIHPL